MNWQFIRAIAEKDLYEVAKNRIAITGAIVLSIIFAVGLPLLITQVAVLTTGSDQQSFDTLLTSFPPALLEQLGTLSPTQLPIVLILGYLIAPLFLILPLVLSCMIAAEAFVGEKERKTLEALLYTPATDAELFLGKLFASIIPAVVYTWVNFLIFALVTNIAGYPVMGRIWFPTDRLADPHDFCRTCGCPSRSLGNGNHLDKGQYFHGSLPGIQYTRHPDYFSDGCPEYGPVIPLTFRCSACRAGVLRH